MTKITVYKIMDKETGLFYVGKASEAWTEQGRAFTRKGVIATIKAYSRHCWHRNGDHDSRDMPENWVVELESILEDSKMTPAKDFV